MAIVSFFGEYRFLSNFYPTPIMFNDTDWAPSVEHAYQAAKTVNIYEQRKILTAESPATAKRYGRMIRHLREGWDSGIRDQAMKAYLDQKFITGVDAGKLGNMLLQTGDQVLIEGNNWGDIYWGMCNGVGQNRLGQMLMAIRTKLQGTLSENNEGAA